MATVLDLKGRPLDKGDLISFKQVESYDFQIMDMGELTIVQLPGQAHGIRQIKVATTVTIGVPYIPGQPVGIPVYLIKKAEPETPPKQEGTLQ